MIITDDVVTDWKCKYCDKRIKKRKDNYTLVSWHDFTSKETLYHVVHEKCWRNFRSEFIHFNIHGFLKYAG